MFEIKVARFSIIQNVRINGFVAIQLKNNIFAYGIIAYAVFAPATFVQSEDFSTLHHVYICSCTDFPHP